MISHVLLALDQPTLQTQLKQRLSRSDVLVNVPRNRQHLWRRIARETCDLVIVSKTLIPGPAVDLIASLGELPDAPEVVVITERNDPEERAALLAAGADEVLHTSLSLANLVQVLETLLGVRHQRNP